MKTDTSSTSPLEHSVLDNLATFLSPDKLKELLACYLRDSQQIITQLDTALTEKDTGEATRLVHSLKSTSANVGAIPLSELAKSLEALARKEKLDAIGAQIGELNQLFDLTQTSIEQLDFMQS